MTKNQSYGIVALTTEPQKIFVQTLRQIDLAPRSVIARLRKRYPKEFGRRTELLPYLSCAGIGMARFRRRLAFDGEEDRPQIAQEFEFLSLAFRGVR